MNTRNTAVRFAVRVGASTLAIAAASAQDPGGITRLPVGGEPAYHTLDLATGELRESDADTVAWVASKSGTGACYANNVDNDPVLDALLFPATDELFDWGVKPCGGSDLVERLTIGYGSQSQPTATGGPGGALTLRIYEGALGFGFIGTEVLDIELSGLPSDGFGPPALLIPRFLTIELGQNAFFLPDGPIGWSYENPDGQTAPLLVDTTIPLGTQNYFDVYRPGPASDGNYLGTFTLPAGGASNDPFENSFWMEIHENATASSAVEISAAANPDVFAAPNGGPIVGSAWSSVVDPSPSALLTFVVLALQDFSGSTTAFGDFLVDLTTQVGKVSTKAGATPHTFNVPLDVDFIGVRLYAQGGFTTNTPAGLQLTNALDMTIGSF